MRLNQHFLLDQKRLYLHVFIRDFFFSAAGLGLVYLYFSGMPIVTVLTGFLAFRILESFVFMPLAQRAFKKIHTKKLLLLSLILQALLLLLFPVVAKNSLFFAAIIVVWSVFDVLYWPIRKNLERSV